MSHYDKEYVVYLTENGVTCEKCYHINYYYNGGGDISFVHEDCSSKLLKHIDSKSIYEFSIVGEYEKNTDKEYECECNEHCDCCEYNDELEIESDGGMHGFSVSNSDENGIRSYSFYSTDMNLVEVMAKLFR